jgi:hypothetical protein
LSAAIVLLVGANKVVTKSILTGREVKQNLLTLKTNQYQHNFIKIIFYKKGYTTYYLTKNDDEIRGKSFGFVIIKKILGEEEGDAAISHITFTKDRKVKKEKNLFHSN